MACVQLYAELAKHIRRLARLGRSVQVHRVHDGGKAKDAAIAVAGSLLSFVTLKPCRAAVLSGATPGTPRTGMA
jgi:hypothetical protein